MKKMKLVISGINLFEGGPLSIYYDFLDSLIKSKAMCEYDIVAFVHKKSLFNRFDNCGISFVELPKSRKSYFIRLYYEYFYFKRFSKKNNVDIWISLHDITPNVKAKKIYTYCHNPSPFRKITKLDIKTGIKNVLFPLFYKWVYKKNIKKTTVIVQQEWMRQAFCNTFKIKAENIIVCLPELLFTTLLPNHSNNQNNSITTFFYPAYPRSFKNYEVVCEAVRILNEIGCSFRVMLTLDGKENKYSKIIYDKYKNVKSIVWCGKLERDEVFKQYNKTDCLLFPSFIETWGLPISEFKQTNKAMIVADASYAYETVGDYKKVSFFNPNSPSELASLMKAFIEKSIVFDGNKQIEYCEPFMRNWDELIEHIMSK